MPRKTAPSRLAKTILHKFYRIVFREKLYKFRYGLNPHVAANAVNIAAAALFAVILRRRRSQGPIYPDQSVTSTASI